MPTAANMNSRAAYSQGMRLYYRFSETRDNKVPPSEFYDQERPEVWPPPASAYTAMQRVVYNERDRRRHKQNSSHDPSHLDRDPPDVSAAEGQNPRYVLKDTGGSSGSGNGGSSNSTAWLCQGLTGLEFDKSQRAVENSEKWRKLAAKSSVVPQRPSRLRD